MGIGVNIGTRNTLKESIQRTLYDPLDLSDCIHCGRSKVIETSFTYETVAQVMHITLGRCGYVEDVSCLKHNQHVPFEELITFIDHKDVEWEYALRSVIVYEEFSPGQGYYEYYAYVRSLHGWYYMNDSEALQGSRSVQHYTENAIQLWLRGIRIFSHQYSPREWVYTAIHSCQRNFTAGD